VLTAPGIPMLFQGQEFLQGEWFRDDVPLDWHLRQDFRGIVRLYRDLIRLRRNASGLTRGLTGQFVNVYHANEIDKVMAYHRWTDHGVGDDVVVLVNLGHADRPHYRIGLPAAGRWSVVFCSDDRRYSPDFAGHPVRDVRADAASHDGLAAGAVVAIPAYSVVIYAYEAAGDGRTPLERLLIRALGRLGRWLFDRRR
jgi:1,4-alpha-glucan branching enzyme